MQEKGSVSIKPGVPNVVGAKKKRVARRKKKERKTEKGSKPLKGCERTCGGKHAKLVWGRGEWGGATREKSG